VRIARGLLNKQVGFELGTTEKTVKAQRARVIKKLEANSLADVVRLVERLRMAGVIPSEAEAPITARRPPVETHTTASLNCAFDKSPRSRPAHSVSIDSIAHAGSDMLSHNAQTQLTNELQRLRPRNRGPALM
jgi:hypothetical protein